MTDIGNARIDGRTKHAKRLRALIDGLLKDLGHAPSVTERALAEQAASLIVCREALERAMAAGEPVNANEVTKLAGVIARCLTGLRSKGGKRSAGSATTIRERLAAQA
ncbi:hypothetical protein [Bradyrhizobium sp. USDA 4520]